MKPAEPTSAGTRADAPASMGFTERFAKSRRLLHMLKRVERLVMIVALAMSAYVGWIIGCAGVLYGEMVMLRASISASNVNWTRARDEATALATTILVGSFVSHLSSIWVIHRRSKGVKEGKGVAELVQFMVDMCRSVVAAMVALPIALRNGWDLLLMIVLLCPVVMMYPRVVTTVLAWMNTPASGAFDQNVREKQGADQIKRILSHRRSIQALHAMEVATKALDSAAYSALTTSFHGIANLVALGILLIYALPVILIFYAGYMTSGEAETTHSLRCMIVAIMSMLTVFRTISRMMNNTDADDKKSSDQSQQANEAKEANIIVWLRPYVFAKRSTAVVGYLCFLVAPALWVLMGAVSAHEVANMFEYHDVSSVAISCSALLFTGALFSLSVKARIHLFTSIGDVLKHRALLEVLALELTTNPSDIEGLEPLTEVVEGIIGDIGSMLFLVPALFSAHKWTTYTAYGVALLAGLLIDFRAAILHASISMVSLLIASLLRKHRGHTKIAVGHAIIGQVLEASLLAIVESSGWFASTLAFGYEMDWLEAGSSTFQSVLSVSVIAMTAFGTVHVSAFEVPNNVKTSAIAIAHRLLQRKVALAHRGVVPRNECRRLEGVNGDVKFKNIPIISETRTRYFNSKVVAGEITVVHGGYASERRSMVKRLLKLSGWNKDSDGKIFLDDVEVSRLDDAWLRQHVTLLEGNPVLIHGTVAENIALGCPGSSWDDIERVAVESGLIAPSLTDALKDNVFRASSQAWLLDRLDNLSVARVRLRQPQVIIVEEDDEHHPVRSTNLPYCLENALSFEEIRPTIIVFTNDDKSTVWSEVANHFIRI